jgi:hypothetical protein
MRLNEVKRPDYVLYVDLDGVLADLTSYVEDLLGITIQTQSDGNWHNDEAIWDDIRAFGGSEPNFQDLKPMPDAMELWDFLKPHRPHILTATGYPVDVNARKKRKWVSKHLTGYDQVYTVEKSKLKAQFAAPNHILIDDRTKSTRPWKQAGGIAILHRSAAETIQKLKDLGF